MAKKQQRFESTYRKDGVSRKTEILRDRETGVSYLFHQWGYGGGITPLLDSQGQVVISHESGPIAGDIGGNDDAGASGRSIGGAW